MSRPKSKAPKAPIPIHTHLPETIPLKESQRVALNLLAESEQRYSQLIQQVRADRAKIVAEIEEEKGMEGSIGANYVYNGRELIKPKAE